MRGIHMEDNCLFLFMDEISSELVSLGQAIEEQLFTDPHSVLVKTRVYIEQLTKLVMNQEKMEVYPDYKLVDRVEKLHCHGILPDAIHQQFDWIRRIGNKAAHEPEFGTLEQVLRVHRSLYDLSVWYRETYGDLDFQAPKYVLPPVNSGGGFDSGELSKLISQAVQQTIEVTLEQKLQTIQEELAKLRNDHEPSPTSSTRSTRKTTIDSPSIDPLVGYLEKLDLEVIDKRPSGGALWVVGGWELNETLFPLKEKKIYFRFVNKGSKSTKNKPAWFLLNKNSVELD